MNVMRKGVLVVAVLFMSVSITGILAKDAFADPQSNNFRLSESSIGSGSQVQSTSTNFRASEAIGDITTGNSKSTSFQVNSGSKTPSDPNLAVAITSGSINFPNFSAATASVVTATFSVLNYTSYGYVVQIAGTAPSNGSKTIPGMITTGPSQIGVEQFGINLVANTSPLSVGQNPNNNQYGFGSASPNYGTPNSFRFVSGETIALASKSSGITDYTISYLVNVAGLTPGGKYTTDQTLIITGTY
ncbi:hypothetical protein H7200_03315 [Candidatus Saccharibacteria bacterium]|nr:hypothetical protein [Candidatus Saccharibacteria bacterium]